MTPSDDQIVFVDLGAFDGRSSRLACKHWDVAHAYLWECHPTLTVNPPPCKHTIIRAAAWTHNGVVPMYLGQVAGKVSQGSTLIREKTTGGLDYDNPTMVKTIDFAHWLHRIDDGSSYIVVKMNVEGAEYDLLQHLSEAGVLEAAAEWHISWHAPKIGLSAEDHTAVQAYIEMDGYERGESVFPGHELWHR